MEKGKASSLFVNDGSFMEKFKQLQEQKEKGPPPLSASQKPNPVLSNNNKSLSGGKLAFSLKQKSKLVTPAVKLSEDEEDDESNPLSDVPSKRQKFDQPSYASDQSLKQLHVGNCFLLLSPLYFFEFF